MASGNRTRPDARPLSRLGTLHATFELFVRGRHLAALASARTLGTWRKTSANVRPIAELLDARADVEEAMARLETFRTLAGETTSGLEQDVLDAQQRVERTQLWLPR